MDREGGAVNVGSSNRTGATTAESATNASSKWTTTAVRSPPRPAIRFRLRLTAITPPCSARQSSSTIAWASATTRRSSFSYSTPPSPASHSPYSALRHSSPSSPAAAETSHTTSYLPSRTSYPQPSPSPSPFLPLSTSTFSSQTAQPSNNPLLPHPPPPLPTSAPPVTSGKSHAFIPSIRHPERGTLVREPSRNVFGEEPRRWWWPGGITPGDGLSFSMEAAP
mmetsp:Transcript_5650/g.14740  ORF Transcript_5650/g.14740 Transcript_5650/m.14740 type:complete len:223 (-) Transcript_5650:255-923(-)